MRTTRNGYDAVAIAKKVAINFIDLSQGCEKFQPCYYFTAALPPYGIRVSGPRSCRVHQGGTSAGSWVECPAKGAVTFHMNGGGTWIGYLGGNGKHIDGPCASGRVTVYTSGARNVTTTVQAWDGCRETIVCAKTKSAVSDVVADRFDVIRGRCTSVTRHKG